MRGKEGHGSDDRAIWALAAGQHGLVTREQLLELGLGSRAIEHRLELGRLRRAHRGVYRIGPTITQHSMWMAAVLACGSGAALSHRAAAGLWGIRNETRIEVTAPRGRKPRPGIPVHRANLPQDEITTHQGIPTTTVPRTLLDLSAVLSRDDLRSAMRQAETLRLTDKLTLGDLLLRYRHRSGNANARAVLEEAQRGLGVTRSELEDRFQAFLIDADLPMPVTNVLIEGFVVDCAWPDEKLIVELDGRAFHETAHAFEADRVRDRMLGAAGWRAVRVTWRQLHDAPAALRSDLRRLLGRAPRAGSRSPSGSRPGPS